MEYVQNLLNQIISNTPKIIAAIFLFIIALVVASIVKAIIVKGGKKLGLNKYTDKIGLKSDKGSLDFIGSLAFFIIFILFVPGILDSLNMRSVSDPIMKMIGSILGYLPNILAAILIIVIAVFLAKLVKNIIETLLKRFNVDKFQSKIGIKETSISFSEVIANFAYALILLFAIVAALKVLNINTISDPALNILNMIMGIIPLIFVAALLIFAGVFLSKIAGDLIHAILNRTGLDYFIVTTMGKRDGKVIDFSCPKLIGDVVRYIIIILFVIGALSVIKLDMLQSIGTNVLAFIPSLLIALLMMAAGLLFGSWLEGLMISKFKISSTLSSIVKYIIYAIAAFMMLGQLGIAKFIVNTSFIMILGALAVAFVISFGLGGKDFAEKMIKKASNKVIPVVSVNPASIPQTQTVVNSASIPQTQTVVNPASISRTQTVYWTDTGKSYHLKKDCSTLSHSTNIKSGPFSKCTKTDPCDICIKQ
ncbi:MAG: mechanosensitive ion channel [Oscillospiraceae bacterium]|nr:mechanosensitive ion channel [Oscillospiraceae bacterium]